MMKKIKYRIEYAAVVFLIFLLNLMPYRLAIAFGDILGVLAFSVIRIRRDVTLENLKKSFGNRYSESKYIEIAKKSYKNIGRGFIEFGLLPKLAKTDLNNLVEIEGEENLRELIEKKSGAVMVTGHFGSWELMGAYLAQKGWPIDFLVGEQHNLKVNELMNSHRRIFGIGLIELGIAARGVIKAVKNGRMVCMLSDQDAGDDGVVVEFLGRPASTPKGPAAFAIKTGAPLACGFAIRNGLRHKVIIEKPVIFYPTNKKEEDIKILTQAYTKRLEEYIYKYPDHWFWPHRRWKSTT